MPSTDEARRLRACKLDKPLNTPSNGDTLIYDSTAQRLVYQAPAATTLPLFSAYNHAGGVSIGSAGAVDIVYDTEVIKDSIFSHSIGVAGVTVSQAGFYRVDVDLAVTVNAGSTVSFVSGWLMKNSTEIEGTRAAIYTPINGSRGSCSISRIIQLVANDVVKMQAQLNTAGNTVATIADGCRLSLTKVGDQNNSGVSGGMLDFSDMDNSAYIPFV